jgi:predicted AlkP superfamily pyrophosphatase or phosphodiesterase
VSWQYLARIAPRSQWPATGDGVFWYEDNFGFTTYLAAGEDAVAKLAPLAGLNVKIKAETASPPANVRPVHLIDPYTMEAARTLVNHFQLGRRGVTDLLAVSLSATDFVGHGYGTQGPEMCDHLYRLDAQIGASLTFLDGLGPRALVVMTGDHGGSGFVERLALRGFASARRIDGKAFLKAVNDELKSKFSLTADPLVTPDFTQFYAVDDKRLALGELLRTKVIEAAVAILIGREEVDEAFSLKDLLSHKVKRSAQSDYSLRDRYALSVMDGRSGDIIVAFKSGIATGPALPTGFLMGHSGPYRNDTAVPIAFWWQGMKGQTRILPVDTTMIAPTLRISSTQSRQRTSMEPVLIWASPARRNVCAEAGIGCHKGLFIIWITRRSRLGATVLAYPLCVRLAAQWEASFFST